MTENNRWYRVPFVWLLVGLPLLAVIGSFVSLALAIHSDDGLVEDDYYRRGKEINRTLARDHAAATHGLQGRIDLDDAHHELRVWLSSNKTAPPPDNLQIKFLHATRAGFDKTFILPRDVDGTYRAPLPSFEPGHWNLQLAAQDWRLTGSLHVPGDHHLDLRPLSP